MLISQRIVAFSVSNNSFSRWNACRSDSKDFCSSWNLSASFSRSTFARSSALNFASSSASCFANSIFAANSLSFFASNFLIASDTRRSDSLCNLAFNSSCVSVIVSGGVSSPGGNSSPRQRIVGLSLMGISFVLLLYKRLIICKFHSMFLLALRSSVALHSSMFLVVYSVILRTNRQQKTPTLLSTCYSFIIKVLIFLSPTLQMPCSLTLGD